MSLNSKSIEKFATDRRNLSRLGFSLLSLQVLGYFIDQSPALKDLDLPDMDGHLAVLALVRSKEGPQALERLDLG